MPRHTQIRQMTCLVYIIEASKVHLYHKVSPVPKPFVIVCIVFIREEIEGAQAKKFSYSMYMNTYIAELMSCFRMHDTNEKSVTTRNAIENIRPQQTPFGLNPPSNSGTDRIDETPLRIRAMLLSKIGRTTSEHLSRHIKCKYISLLAH